MGLTATKSLRLEDAGLDALFSQKRPLWKTLTQNAYDYVSEGLEDSGEPVRRDDLIAPLIPVLEVSSDLRDYLAENRLTQKYWYEWFAELVADRLWSELEGEEEEDE